MTQASYESDLADEDDEPTDDEPTDDYAPSGRDAFDTFAEECRAQGWAVELYSGRFWYRREHPVSRETAA